MTRLTDTTLRGRLKEPRAVQSEIVDGAVPGLAVRVGRGPAATWSLVLRVRGEGGVSRRGFAKKGRRYRFTLGNYPEMSLDEARARANEFRSRANAGESPAIALERAAAGRLTVQALSARFLEDYARSKNLRSTRKYEQAIATHIVPHLGDIPVDALDREEVRSLIRHVRVPQPRADTQRGRARGGIEAARRALGVLRLMVGWAIEERLVNREDNPASRMERNLPRKRKGDRVLSLEEMRAVWRAADSGFAFDNHVRLTLLTACRAGEWARARWSWVDLKRGLLTIPADEYKTNRPHVVPLVPEAVAILENSFRGGKGDYVLSTAEGERPIRGLAKFYQTRLPQAIFKQSEAVISPFASHDLRRSVASGIAESLGIGGEPLVRRLLGHADSSVTAIYNRYAYLREMRAALEAWARELTRD
ncbi:MAG TPA: tyrosine-type recombinase/integrase [Steroidobacteraceae bacterium]|jgi:integrase|nr:tyrosine-type recombinase/integrase [Steroidobacteraceae bacterium]